MIQLIAWIGAITGFLAGIIMLFGTGPVETRTRTRLRGILFIGVGALNVALALGMARGVL